MIFRARSRRLANKAATKFVKLPLMTALEKVFTECNNLLVDGKGYVSENGYLEMMDELKYSRIRDAIEGLHLTENWDKVLNYRKKFISVYRQMKSINSIAFKISKTIEEYKDFPFCFPEIVDDSKNIVSFGSIAPLHLIGRKNKQQTADLGKDDLKLITGLPALNGQIISITGQNGGGKTVIETELIYSLYLAHCGLPVFADNFVMNAKDVIAMVFVERGEGSMLQLIMQKLKNIAEEIENNENNKVIVIIDELLTGTQEDVGLQIGKQYLSMLARKKCSVMFVTQITQLAEFANQNLNALCFHFDSKGELQHGIGKGNAMVLAEEVGLDKFLNPA